MTALTEAIQRVAARLRTTTYYGPNQPAPAATQAEVDAFVASHTFVQGDPEYIAFLRQYGGGLIGGDKDAVSLGVYGFSWKLCPHIVEQGAVVDDHGFFTFADLFIDSGLADDLEADVQMAFSLDATGERRAGIYARIGDEGQSEWFCEDFVAWLQLIADTAGRLDRAGS